jgi:hypothetical protein
VARASVTYRYPDGNEIMCEVEAAAEHPDALDQIVGRVVTLWLAIESRVDSDDAEDG